MEDSSIIMHYIDGIMIISETKEQAKTDLNAMVMNMTNWAV